MAKNYTYWYTVEKLVYASGNCTKAVIKYYGDCVYAENTMQIRYAEFVDVNFDPVKPIIGVDVTEVLTKGWIDPLLTDDFINPVKERLRIRLEKTADERIATKAAAEAAEEKDKLPWEDTKPEDE